MALTWKRAWEPAWNRAWNLTTDVGLSIAIVKAQCVVIRARPHRSNGPPERAATRE